MIVARLYTRALRELQGLREEFLCFGRNIQTMIIFAYVRKLQSQAHVFESSLCESKMQAFSVLLVSQN